MRTWVSTVLVTAATLACAPAALADFADSSNWSGYAVHRHGVSFRTVSGTWTQPNATCVPGNETYSAFWVGLGGFSENANALEQIGTEVDCDSSGKVSSTAWYELVPDPSIALSLVVRPGDHLRARVTTVGHRVLVSLYDVTRHRGFRKVVRAPSVDVSSAEWIAEAPSECVSLFSCRTLPLADFGSTTFDGARALSTTGHLGTISDTAWEWTKIRLSPAGQGFVLYNGSGPSAGGAAPSPLDRRGASFKVTYARVSVGATRFRRAFAASSLPGRVVHPRR